MKKNNKNLGFSLKAKANQGFSLIETLIVLIVFTTIALVTSQALMSTLSLSTKAKSTAKVRSEVDYALSIIERHLHNSSTLVNCPNSDKKIIEYQDRYGNLATFSCQSINNDNFIASGSARLTSEIINISTCNLDCFAGTDTNPGYVQIDIVASEKLRTGKESAQIDVSSLIHLRSN